MKKGVIYCYSSTGNSMFVAKSIARCLGDASVVLAPSETPGQVAWEAERLGLVFPVIGWGLPRFVLDFVEQLNVRPGQYVFAVATCGGTPGPTMLQLRSLLRAKGVTLAAGFVVRSPSPGVFAREPGIVRFVRTIAGRKPLPAEERLGDIADVVSRRAPHRAERSSFAANVTARLFRAMMKKAAARFKEADRNMSVDGACTKCRTCVRVCPRGNVSIVNGAHVWRHDCEMCMACVTWCPAGAMHFGPASSNGRRRHHPGVTATEMMVRA